jgi:hypothetical protein
MNTLPLLQRARDTVVRDKAEIILIKELYEHLRGDDRRVRNATRERRTETQDSSYV